MSTQSAQVWQAFVNSMQAGDRRWEGLVSDDIVFSGPMDQVRGKSDFIKLNDGFFKMVVGHDIHQHTASGDTVATQCTLKVKSPKGNEVAIDLAEFYKIKEGKIQSVTIYWDPREFMKEFSN